MSNERQTLLKFCYESFMEDFFNHADVDRHLHIFNGFVGTDITKEEFEAYADTVKRSKKK